MEESRQLAKWSSVIESVIRRIHRQKFLKWSTGGLEDCRQIAKMAVLEVILTPQFAAANRKEAYLARCIWRKLVDAARGSALIRTHHRDVAASKAKTVALMDDMDSVASPEEKDEPGEGAVKETRDITWAIGRLPATIRKVMGHLFGVAGYDKLSPDDTARRLGIKVSTVRRQAYEGRRLLRNLLKDCGYTEVGNG